MKKKLSCLVTLYLIFTISQSQPPTFTHKLTRGRLGDHLISYAQCKYLSWKYHVPMLYRQFRFSDQFMFSTSDTRLTNAMSESFRKTKRVTRESQLHHLETDTLYELNYEVEINGGIVKAVWESPNFQLLLKEAWQSHSSFKRLSLPNNTITIALHVRKGSGPDFPLFSDQIYPSSFNQNILRTTQHPKKSHCYEQTKRWHSDRGDHVLKFPPEQYYIDQLILISELLDNRPLHVHLFTDSNNPKELAQRLEQRINKKNIIIHYQDKKNKANNISDILQDFFDMTQFDILIRSNSNFSKAAQLIGDHAIGIHPHIHRWDHKKLIIEKTCAIVRNKNNTLIKKYILPDGYQYLKKDMCDIFSIS